MKKYVMVISGNGKHKYSWIVKPMGFGKTYKRVVSLGNIDKLHLINPNYQEIIKENLQKFEYIVEPDQLKNKLLETLKETKEKTFVSNVGISAIYSVVDSLNIFESINKTKRKNLKELLKYQIGSRILNNYSMIKSFQNKENFTNNITTKKDTFYNLLDILVDNENNIMQTLNKEICSKTDRNIELVFYDSSTVYFESFVRDGFRQPGYSKDGKFKEDQVVIGMATDSNGIPIFIKVFKGNTSDINTFIPFILEMKKAYNISKITIIADKGMSSNKNIRFLESLGIDFIISYRAKAGSQNFKKIILDPTGYQGDESFKYKELEYESTWKNERKNGKIRRKIITYSKSRAHKDEQDRKILINNFKKHQNSKGVVKSEQILGAKKYKFFKQVGNLEFTLDYQKIEEDSKFDGVYVYETSRLDLSASEIVQIYHKQWQIEENFRSLKNALKVRPIYVWTNKHIKGHFILCFIALVVLKYTLYKINKFYSENGVIEKYTNNTLIELLNSCNEVRTYRNNELISSKFVNTMSKPYASDEFNEIMSILKSCI